MAGEGVLTCPARPNCRLRFPLPDILGSHEVGTLSRPGSLKPEWRFHAELVDIFDSLHDLPARYVLP
jgi:hypothetical protein